MVLANSRRALSSASVLVMRKPREFFSSYISQSPFQVLVAINLDPSSSSPGGALCAVFLPLNILSFQEVSSSHPGAVSFLLTTGASCLPFASFLLESTSVQSLGTKYVSRQHWASF